MVVGVDFSAGSHAAVRYALAVASPGRREVHFVHVAEAGKAAEADSPSAELERICEQLREFAGGLDEEKGAVRHVVLTGKAETGLLGYAREAGAGCLILGSAGWGPGQENCGSVCRACLRQDLIPVRVVQAGTSGPCEVRVW